MRKILFLFVVGLFLAGCSGSTQPDKPSAEAPQSGESSTVVTESEAPPAEASSPEQAPDAPQDAAQVAALSTSIYVYKSPTCGCCGNWVDQLVDYGFEVQTEDVDNLADIKTQKGVPDELLSCHTAVAGDYIIEGHVPPADIERLLTEQPDALGLAVPGMIVGSPGMEVPGAEGQPYDVILFDASGQTSVFASYNKE